MEEKVAVAQVVADPIYVVPHSAGALHLKASDVRVAFVASNDKFCWVQITSVSGEVLATEPATKDPNMKEMLRFQCALARFAVNHTEFEPSPLSVQEYEIIKRSMRVWKFRGHLVNCAVTHWNTRGVHRTRSWFGPDSLTIMLRYSNDIAFNSYEWDLDAMEASLKAWMSEVDTT